MKTFTRVRSIANVMRVLAVAWMLGGVLCFIPYSWGNLFLAWFGMEPIPQSLFMTYCLCGAGFLGVGIGAVIWAVATDVVKYRPIVITIVTLHLIGAPMFFSMDLIIGMPLSWRIMDLVTLLMMGGIPLAFCLWPAKKSPNKSRGRVKSAAE
jgi:hypothetical protein